MLTKTIIHEQLINKQHLFYSSFITYYIINTDVYAIFKYILSLNTEKNKN